MNYLVNASTDVGTQRENNQDSMIVQVAGNGLRMFCLIFNLVAHVVYLGFTKRPLTVEPPRATKGRRKR